MNSNSSEIWNDLDNKEYRDAFVRANVFSWIAFQIRELREQKGLSQKSFADLCGKKQSVISRLENSAQRGVNLTTLTELASSLDIALIVKFIPFSKFLREYQDVSPQKMRVDDYERDRKNNVLCSGKPVIISQNVVEMRSSHQHSLQGTKGTLPVNATGLNLLAYRSTI